MQFPSRCHQTTQSVGRTSFSQVPQDRALFVGKAVGAGANGKCVWPVTLALFHLDWNTHKMTLVHRLMEVPLEVGPHQVIQNAYDPYVAEFHGETWVAFECAGQGIAGVSACVAPLVGNGKALDTERLTIPVAGLDADHASPWLYSASTPKLLNFRDRLYLYWTAIQVDKAPPRRWNGIETRGVEAVLDGGKMWAKGFVSRAIPSNAPGANVAVMTPLKHDRYQDTSVDTEGLFVFDDQIIALSSVGGGGCTKPLDNTSGCFRLEITQTDHPLANDGFRDRTMVSPKLPANPSEYPRVVTSPTGQTYLMTILHAMTGPAAPASGRALNPGYVLIPLDLPSLIFVATGQH